MAQAQAMLVDGVMMMVCGWFAGCRKGTLKAAPHPILDYVPTCDRCRRAARISATDMLDIEIVVEN